ncbi:MAG TPA: 3'-5' exonuclease, partial [Solirubrobacteraceae bacterium]|nr:3'-5' exonuclease [Solirubrobacteraceae bacterium]
MVDEYQDTNHAQYRWLQLLAGEHRNLSVVGDPDQCLVEGTLVRMADGSERPIETVRAGDWVLSGYGSGVFRPARVTGVHRGEAAAGVEITTAGGRRILSTPEHVHFAGGNNLRLDPTGSQSWKLFPLSGNNFGRDDFVFTRRSFFPPGHRLEISLCGAGAGTHAVALVEPDGRRRRETCTDLSRIRHGSHLLEVRPSARLGQDGKELPFTQASAVRPGMVMFDEHGGYDSVTAVRGVVLDRPVYDLNIERTHNFIAGGIVTHNSIYGFRGADIHNILGFQDSFPDARVIRLEQNYRSTQTILDAANAIIANNRGRMEKLLWTDVGQGDSIKVRELEDEHAEARFVTGEIQRLLDGGTSRSEIAVFYRTNAQSRVLQDTLVRAEIAYQVIGGTKFYERAEIKDAISYLTVMVNPQDIGAFTRIVNSPRRGIGATSLAKVLSFADTMGVTIWDAASEPEQIPGLGAAAQKAFGRFMGTMHVLRERAGSGAPISQLMREVLTETGYLEALQAERTIEAQGRIENLEELINVAAEYDAAESAGAESGGESAAADSPGLSALADFLQQVALISDADDRSDDEGLITLMTLHNAKGLEYPIVFIIGCEEGVFPHSRAIDEGGLEEERRLCYVGITRAERDLYMTYARSRTVFGARGFGIPSRFIAEIPADLTDREQQPRGFGAIRARMTSWSSGGSSAPGGSKGNGPSWGADSQEAPVAYRLGEDVYHPSFGEGVVTATEPGGIVVIRFSRDGSERKLVADLAPISKR